MPRRHEGDSYECLRQVMQRKQFALLGAFLVRCYDGS
jgi:hypothetical protein